MSAVDIELEKKWTPKKEQSLILSDSYVRLDWIRKAERVADCGSWLEFVERSEQGQGGTGPGCPCGAPDGTPPARPPTNCITQISVVIGSVRCVAGDVAIKYLVKSVR